MVARPLQDVHRQDRRVGHLQEEDLLARDRRDRRRVVAERQRVKAVEDQAQVRMVRAFDDRPRLAVAVDVAAPGERLVADAQVPSRRALRELVKLGGAALRVGEAALRRVRAHQHRRRTERLHQVELALGAVAGCARGRRRACLRSRGTAGTGRSTGRGPPAIARRSAALPSKLTKSASNSSMPSKRAAAIACSFWRSVPLIDTVAIDLRIAAGSFQ